MHDPRTQYPRFALNADLACTPNDNDKFFVEDRPPDPRADGGRRRIPKTEPARRLCRSCPRRDDCLSWAMGEDEEEGIWGGFTPRERRLIRNVRAWRGYTAAQLERVIKDTPRSAS